MTYVPLTSGMYTLLLKYGGRPVPGFPAKVMADPAVDTSKVKVFGPGLEGQGSVTNPPLLSEEEKLRVRSLMVLCPLMQLFSERPPPISQWTPVPWPSMEETT